MISELNTILTLLNGLVMDYLSTEIGPSYLATTQNSKVHYLLAIRDFDSIFSFLEGGS